MRSDTDNTSKHENLVNKGVHEAKDNFLKQKASQSIEYISKTKLINILLHYTGRKNGKNSCFKKQFIMGKWAKNTGEKLIS